MELSSRGNDGRSSSSKGKESTRWLGFEEPSHPYATPGSSDDLTVKCHALVPLGGGCMGKFPDARLASFQMQGCKAPIAGPCFAIINDYKEW